MKNTVAALLLCLGAFFCVGTLGAASAERVYHTSDATCDGWPRAPIGMASAWVEDGP